MATTTSKPDIDMADSLPGTSLPAWPHAQPTDSGEDVFKPSHRDALHALLAFSSLHDQVRRRKALASRQSGFDSPAPAAEFEPTELFVLDEVLQLVAERAVAITGADGLAIALAETSEIVLRASAGTIRPDPGTRIERDSAFSGACFRTAQVIHCDDTETDTRVNVEACRKMGARSMVAVPLCGRRRVIGVLEAFSSWPFAFNEIDIRNLSLLAELVLGALKPEDEDRFAQSAQVAATKLEQPPTSTPIDAAVVATKAAMIEPSVMPVKPVVVAAAAPTLVVPSPTITAPVVPVIKTEPLTAEAKPAAAMGILDPAILESPAIVHDLVTEKFSEAVVAPEVAEPELFAHTAEPASHKPYALIMLVFIVIGTAIAGGVWWR